MKILFLFLISLSYFLLPELVQASVCDIIIFDIENTSVLRVGIPVNVYVEVFNSGNLGGMVHVTFQGLDNNVYTKSEYFSPGDIKRIYFDNIVPTRSGWVSVSSTVIIDCSPPRDDLRIENWYVLPDSTTYSVTFFQSGIPSGITWGVTVGNTRYTSTSSSLTVSGLSGTVSYSYDSVVQGNPGIRYYCTTSCSGTISSSTTINANYRTQYQLTMQVNPSSSGTTIPSVGSHWYDAGSTVTINALPNAGYQFSSWSGSGSGSYSGTTNPVNIVMNSPINQIANFAYVATYNVTFTQTGLPIGTYWSVTFNGITRSSNGTSITFSNILPGNYFWSVSTPISCSPGCRYVASPSSGNLNIPSQLSQSVIFTKQFQVYFSANPLNAGTTSPSGTQWYDSGSTINIAASPFSGYSFYSWSASTSLISITNPSSSSTTATINGAGTITANFQPISSFDFSISLNPTSSIIQQGQSTTSVVTISLISGAPQPVSLSVSGCPPNAICTVLPSSGNPNFSSTLSISTTSMTPTGNYQLTISGTSGSLTRQANFTLTITSSAQPGFLIIPFPTSQTIVQGSSTSYVVAVTSLNNFIGFITLTAFNCPPGATPNCNFSPTNIVFIAPGINGTTNLNVFTNNFTNTGSYNILIQGSSGLTTNSTSVLLNVISPPSQCVRRNPSISIYPSTQNATPGQALVYIINVTNNDSPSCNASVFSLTFSCPAGFTCNLASNSLTIQPSSTSSTQIFVTSSSLTSAGSYVFSVTARNNFDLTRQATSFATYIIPSVFDFSVSISPSSATLIQGQSIQALVSANLISAPSQSVNLSCANLPAGTSCNFIPTTCSPTCSSILTITTSSTTPTGTYNILILGTNGSIIRSTNFLLTVRATTSADFDFSISANPSSLFVKQGETVSSTITLTLISGTSRPVSLNVISSPGIDASILPTSCSPNCSAVLTVRTSSSTNPGNYFVIVVATGSTKTISIPITVLEATPFPLPLTQTSSPRREVSYPIAVVPQVVRLAPEAPSIQPTQPIEIVRGFNIPLDILILILIILIFLILLLLLFMFLPFFWFRRFRRKRCEPEDP